MAKEKTAVVRGKSGGGASTAVFALLFAVAALVAGVFLGAEAYHQRTEIRELRAELERAKSGMGELVGTYIDKAREGIATTEEVAKISKRIDEIAAAKGADFMLLTSAALLKDKVERGLPFKDELAAVANLAKSDKAVGADIAALGDFSDGVKSVADLKSEFEKIADEIVFMADNTAGGKPNALQRFWIKAKGLVKIRKLSAEGYGADAIVARVERLLEAGDTAGAAAEFSKINISGDESLALVMPWFDAARANGAATQAADRLYLHALGRAAPGLGPK